MEQVNFIVVLLCDNDFSCDLKHGLHSLVDAKGIDFCPIIARRFMIEYLVSASIRRRILSCDILNEEGLDVYRKTMTKYFNRLSVERRQKLPTNEDGSPIDHDGGSVYYDVNLDEFFFF